MNQTSEKRIHAGLHAMLSGKMLYRRCVLEFECTECMVFIDPDHDQHYVTMTITYVPAQRLVKRVEIYQPTGEWVLQSLGATGEHVQSEEIFLDTPEAQRVLAMYRCWTQINQYRVDAGAWLVGLEKNEEETQK